MSERDSHGAQRKLRSVKGPASFPGAAERWRLRRRARPAKGVLRRRLRGAGDTPPGAPLTGHELKVLSQNGEDGVLQALFEALGTRSRWFVEFGIGTGEQGNCVLLADAFGWSGVFIEADESAYAALEAKYRRTPRIRTVPARLTADNVQSVFAQAGVAEALDLLSIDIDGNDYWVWEAIRDYEPRVVVLEYNANLPLDSLLVMPRDDDHAWDGTDYFGASLGALRALGSRKGYELVHTDSTGVNAFFVRAQEAAVVLPNGGPPLHRANYFGAGGRMPEDPSRRPFLDLRTGSLVDAPRAASEPVPSGA